MISGRARPARARCGRRLVLPAVEARVLAGDELAVLLDLRGLLADLAGVVARLGGDLVGAVGGVGVGRRGEGERAGDSGCGHEAEDDLAHVMCLFCWCVWRTSRLHAAAARTGLEETPAPDEVSAPGLGVDPPPVTERRHISAVLDLPSASPTGGVQDIRLLTGSVTCFRGRRPTRQHVSGPLHATSAAHLRHSHRHIAPFSGTQPGLRRAIRPLFPQVRAHFRCAPGRTRTCDQRIRRPLLYPAELRRRRVGTTVGTNIGTTRVWFCLLRNPPAQYAVRRPVGRGGSASLASMLYGLAHPDSGLASTDIVDRSGLRKHGHWLRTPGAAR